MVIVIQFVSTLGLVMLATVVFAFILRLIKK